MKTDIETIYDEILEQGAEQYFSAPVEKLRDHIVVYADPQLKIALHAIKTGSRFNGYLEGPKELLLKHWNDVPNPITWYAYYASNSDEDVPATELPDDEPKQFEGTYVIGWDYFHYPIHPKSREEWNNLSLVVSEGFRAIFPIYGLEFPEHSSNCIFSP